MLRSPDRHHTQQKTSRILDLLKRLSEIKWTIKNREKHRVVEKLIVFIVTMAFYCEKSVVLCMLVNRTWINLVSGLSIWSDLASDQFYSDAENLRLTLILKPESDSLGFWLYLSLYVLYWPRPWRGMERKRSDERGERRGINKELWSPGRVVSTRLQ